MEFVGGAARNRQPARGARRGDVDPPRGARATNTSSRAIATTTAFTADFQDLITRYAWGEIWGRPGLDRRMRSAVTLTALVAGGHWEEFAMHVRAALRNGVTRDEIGEILLQTAMYCSVPSANRAFAIADEVLARRRGRPKKRPDP